MPVTRDIRYLNKCAKVNNQNIKIGKSLDFDSRRKNYFKDFDEHNVIFKPIACLEDIKSAEKAVLKELSDFRMLSPKGGKLEWIEGVSYDDAKKAVLSALTRAKISFIII